MPDRTGSRIDVTVYTPFEKLPLRSLSLSKGGEGWGEGSKQQGGKCYVMGGYNESRNLRDMHSQDDLGSEKTWGFLHTTGR
jgi:hypothetical protein